MDRCALVDGLNLAYRCFHAIPDLKRSDGYPTNALHGWVRSLWRLVDDLQPARVIVVFDLGEDQRRLALLPEYKQQRKAMPDELRQQLPALKESVRLMGFPVVEEPETEADDLIAALAGKLATGGNEVLIYSADKDLAQCVNERVKLLQPPRGPRNREWTFLDSQAVREKFGVPPDRIAELLAVIGDSADNIPGLNGVGVKTAAKWLSLFGSLDSLLANAATVTPVRFREVLAGSAALLRRNLELTRLDRGMAPPMIPPARANPPGFFRFLEEMEMRGVLSDARKRMEAV